jgi:hypothetical protein
MTIELKPCPFCGEELHFEGAGYEHPYSDTCQLDSLYIEDRHITAWNTRADAALRRDREPQPDALALVAAAYRDAAEQPAGIADALKPIAAMKAVDRERCEAVIGLYESMAEATRQRTPADAQAALTAIERAAYERGVRDAQNAMRDAVTEAEYEAANLALLTQEGR